MWTGPHTQVADFYSLGLSVLGMITGAPVIGEEFARTSPFECSTPAVARGMQQRIACAAGMISEEDKASEAVLFLLGVLLAPGLEAERAAELNKFGYAIGLYF
jgi:hypothetical protein